MAYLTQDEMAAALDVSQARVSQATKNDQTVAGLPVQKFADYRTNGRVAGYDVPDLQLPSGAMDRIKALRAEKTNDQRAGRARSNPSRAQRPDLSTEGQQLMGWAQAVNNNATPVAANVSAAGAVASLSGAVREHPQIMENLTDLAASLGTGALMAYVTSPDTNWRWAKVLGGLVSGFSFMKLLRHWTSRDHRRVDMIERGQQAEIERQRDQRQLAGRRNRRLPGSGSGRATQNHNGLA